jgi:5-methylcytosine-specific restriction endonuclease McrA
MARNYSNIMRDIPVMSTYRGYMTNDPAEALISYKANTGFDGTVVVIRPDFEVIADHPLLMTSRHAAANIILVSHLMTPQEIVDSEPTGLAQYENKSIFVSKSVDYSKLKADKLSVPKHKVGRPQRQTSRCPHCKSKIEDFESLGYWYGWGLGIIPSYWEELSNYVFRRDDYTCLSCGKRFGSAFLVAHHIACKEEGGVDSAKNLQTVCVYCHQDTKPIYDDGI